MFRRWKGCKGAKCHLKHEDNAELEFVGTVVTHSERMHWTP